MRCKKILLHRLRNESGMALVLALGVMIVIGIMGSSLVLYSQSNVSSAQRSNKKQSARSLAEAGLGSAISVLANPANAALLPTQALLPASQPVSPQISNPDGSKVWYWGTVTPPVVAGLTGIWKLTSKATVPTPNAGTTDISSTLYEDLQFYPEANQPSSTEAWNFIYSSATGAPGVAPANCDETIYNNTNINASLYVTGNLCLQTPSSIIGPASASSPKVILNVRGFLKLNSNTNVGTPSNKLTEVHLGVGCWNKSDQHNDPCKNADKVYPASDAIVPVIPKPVADFPNWYLNSYPGPMHACVTQSGTPPTWDTNTTLDNGIVGVVDLTPVAAYSCVTPYGSITWAPGTPGTLTVSGTMYIDGSLTSTASIVNYNGTGVIYVSGTFLLKNTSLCAIVNAGNTGCDATAWTAAAVPDILLIAANSSGGQVPTGDSIEIKGGNWQGALYGTSTVEVDTTSSAQGPMVAPTEIISQTGGAPFPQFLTVPFGTPGNAIVNYKALTPLNFRE
jgi:type II secretory pathway pseudopilin PulG